MPEAARAGRRAGRDARRRSRRSSWKPRRLASQTTRHRGRPDAGRRSAARHAACLSPARQPRGPPTDLMARLAQSPTTRICAGRRARRGAREAAAQAQQHVAGTTAAPGRARPPRGRSRHDHVPRRRSPDARHRRRPRSAARKRTSRRKSTRPPSTLRALQEKVAPRVRELRDMDEWRRFANAQRQEQLIAMAEAIVASLKAEEEAGKASDLAATARALRELHAKWQEVADAPRHSAQRLWDRFRTATDFIRSRCEAYFAQMRAGAQHEPAEEGGARRGSRSAGRLDRLGQGRRALPGAAEGLAGDRAGAARRRRAIWRSASAPRATRSSRVAARI